MKLDSENCEFSSRFTVCDEVYQVVRDICVDEGAFNTNIEQLKFNFEMLEIEEVDEKKMIKKPDLCDFISPDLKDEGKLRKGEANSSPKNIQSLADLLSIPLDREEHLTNNSNEIMEPLIGEDNIVYSGGVAYAGSQSLRSESSTGSFAFPILQAEWSWSPVRMAKADRRHRRLLTRWRSRMLCCKF